MTITPIILLFGKLKSLKVAKWTDEGGDEGCEKGCNEVCDEGCDEDEGDDEDCDDSGDEWLIFSCLRGFADWLTDICDCRVAFNTGWVD